MTSSECRENVLELAKKAVLSDRNMEYGEPEDSFERIAKLWNACYNLNLEVQDVAIMLALLKIARLANNPGHLDSWVDLVGYAACGCASCRDKKTM